MDVSGPALVGISDGQPPGPSRRSRQGGGGLYTMSAPAQASPAAANCPSMSSAGNV